MGKTFDEILKERPGNPERRAAFKEQMLGEVRAYKLRELRELLALTQTDLAETLEISQKRVSEIERGQVDFTKVDTLRRYVDDRLTCSRRQRRPGVAGAAQVDRSLEVAALLHRAPWGSCARPSSPHPT
ncbi:MAG: hypothetical protein CSB46_11620 [Micrococcales bacterium]|nr:MAG: hypothetical protein CSB46_11620 [Micrococcales bacterium]